MKTIFLIKGGSLMMHNRRLRDTSDPVTRKLRLLTLDLMGTSDPDERVRVLAQLADLEWEAGMYYNDTLGPYLPAELLQAGLRDGYKHSLRFSEKTGTLPSSVRVAKDTPLIYDGPRTLDELRQHPDFRDKRMVKLPRQRQKVERTRPIFKDWSAEVEVTYKPPVSSEDVYGWLRSGGGHGIGSGRFIGHGKFQTYTPKATLSA